MATEISFKEVCRFIKEDDPDLIESVDLLLGFVLIVTPLAVSVPSVIGPALGLLGVKNELSKLGKGLYERITKKTDKDNLAFQQRMEAAYGLLSFTAFFEALDSLLPDIRKEIGLKADETFELSKRAISRMQKESEGGAVSIGDNDLTVVLPHPAEEFEDQRKLLFTLYEELSSGFLSFLKRTESWFRIDDEDRPRLTEKIQRVPTLAMKYFDAQYFTLATKYDSFFIWSNLHEYQELRKRINYLSTQLQRYIILAERKPTKADIGLARVGEFLERFPQIQVNEKPKVTGLLEKFYTSQIQLPIIKDRITNAGTIPLVFPKKSHIFIPQAFRVTKHIQGDPLADEKRWENKPARDDLGAFLLSYLSSPYSLESPLIILGHPGSGKSLLTEILAAKLLSTSYSPIRIVLREVLSDTDITSQIEQQLHKDLGISLSWADLAVELQDQPLLIIFDGYDELLQTSGQVISDFLIKLQAFQEKEKAIRSPVRIIITSRITLID